MRHYITTNALTTRVLTQMLRGSKMMEKQFMPVELAISWPTMDVIRKVSKQCGKEVFDVSLVVR